MLWLNVGVKALLVATVVRRRRPLPQLADSGLSAFALALRRTSLGNLPAWSIAVGFGAATEILKAAGKEKALQDFVDVQAWGTPKQILDKLEKRLEVSRQLLQGTNVGESVLAALNREATNMLQGLVVISDGRSTQGAETLIKDVRDRAKRENVPV